MKDRHNMADDTDSPNGQGRSHALTRLKPPASATTNNEAAPTVPRSKSPPRSRVVESSTKPAAVNSQALSKSLPASAVPSAQGGPAAETSGSSPYGTRSRNRTGNTRPNYAEDREMEEFDWHSTKKSTNSRASPAASLPHGMESDKPVGVSTRRSSNATSGAANGKVGPPNPSKDSIPGMSTFSLGANGSTAVHPPPSKKRKAPGNNGNSTHAPTGLGNSASNGHSRRQISTASAIDPRQTNMLSFDVCQGYLKNGRLNADDGTSLGINGMLNQIFSAKVSPWIFC